MIGKLRVTGLSSSSKNQSTASVPVSSSISVGVGPNVACPRNRAVLMELEKASEAFASGGGSPPPCVGSGVPGVALSASSGLPPPPEHAASRMAAIQADQVRLDNKRIIPSSSRLLTTQLRNVPSRSFFHSILAKSRRYKCQFVWKCQENPVGLAIGAWFFGQNSLGRGSGWRSG